MKKHFSSILIIVIMIVGLSLLLYPTISDYVNSLHQSRAVAEYAEAVANLDVEAYDKMLSEAQEYNRKLSKITNRYAELSKNSAEYNSILNLNSNGMMGYIEIPSISCSLPIYHSVNDSVLQVAVGHIEWSSLPVGGESTHCVLSGHRGLPSAKLFSNLDKLAEGDIFMLRILDEIYTYEVDKISIVKPEETDELVIYEGKDLCTLVTCTPYGVNTHRILVRGKRIDNIEAAKLVRVTADAIQIETYIVAPIVAIPILVIMLVTIGAKDRKNKKKRSDD